MPSWLRLLHFNQFVKCEVAFVVLNFQFLITSQVEHLLICLILNQISSNVNCLFISLTIGLCPAYFLGVF